MDDLFIALFGESAARDEDALNTQQNMMAQQHAMALNTQQNMMAQQHAMALNTQQNMMAQRGGLMSAANAPWAHMQNITPHHIAPTSTDACVESVVLSDRVGWYSERRFATMEEVRNSASGAGLFDAMLLLHAAGCGLAEGEHVKLLGVGSVRRLECGGLFFRIYR